MLMLRTKFDRAQVTQISAACIEGCAVLYIEEADKHCLEIHSKIGVSYNPFVGTFAECHALLNKLNDVLNDYYNGLYDDGFHIVDLN